MKRKRVHEDEGPPERGDTIRHQIAALLEQASCSAKDISRELGIPEKEAYGHLDHLRLSLERSGRRLVVVPPECRKCGFVFTHLERLRKPGKCPSCRGESVHEPLFSVAPKEQGITRVL